MKCLTKNELNDCLERDSVCSLQEGNHQWELVWFSDFQRKLRFGSKIAERWAVDLQNLRESQLPECSLFYAL